MTAITMVTEQSIWTVFCPTRGEVRKTHTSKEDANSEALRLSVKHPEHIFYVMESIQMYRAIPQVTTYICEDKTAVKKKIETILSA